MVAIRRVRVLLVAVLVAVSALVAGTVPGAAADPFPLVPKAAKGTQCVEDTDFMRRNHMALLSHERDGTVRQGIRGGKHSLAECISCHATKGDDGQYLTVESGEHFCAACHQFAAVQPDCFMCHAQTPEGGAPKGTMGHGTKQSASR